MSKADFVVLLLKIFFIISTGWILKSHVFCFFVLVNLVMFISMHWRCNLNYKSWVIQLNKIEWGRYQPRVAFAGISESNPGSNRHCHAESRIASAGTHIPQHMEEQIFTKSKTGEEYMNYVHKLLSLVREKRHQPMGNHGQYRTMGFGSTRVVEFHVSQSVFHTKVIIYVGNGHISPVRKTRFEFDHDLRHPT